MQVVAKHTFNQSSASSLIALLSKIVFCFCFRFSACQLMVSVGLGPGGLDSWDPLMKGSVT